jgi:ABC-type transport system substrate-binding protein
VDDPSAKRQAVAAVEFTIGGDELTQQMMFERGELDMLFSIPAPDFVRLTTDPAWKPYISSLPVNETVYLSLNCELAPFTDRRVRQALNYAVDKERIVKLINGRGVPARGVLPPLLPGYNPRLRGYPHDPEKARRLLAEAGYPDGFTVPLWAVADSGSWLKIAEAVQQDLAEVGVRADIRPVAYGIFDEAVGRRRTVPLALTSWPQDYPDPSNFLDVLFRSDRLTEARCNNTAFYASTHVDALLEAASRETDPAQRLRRYQKAEEAVVEDAPWVFLYHPTDYRVCQPWVHGFHMHPVWAARFDQLEIARP